MRLAEIISQVAALLEVVLVYSELPVASLCRSVIRKHILCILLLYRNAFLLRFCDEVCNLHGGGEWSREKLQSPTDIVGHFINRIIGFVLLFTASF